MFASFYLAGFECSTGYNMHGEWIDQIAATEHDLHCDGDYARLEEVGIYAVREAIRWPLVDRRGTYDFSSVEPFVKAAQRHGFDVIWDLFHYGYPDDVDLFSAAFPQRFAEYCRAAARYIRQRTPATCYFTPINEPSYLAWAAGEVGRFAPHAKQRGFELKQALARAALQGITAIRDVCPDARIVNVDPICRVATAEERPAVVEHARRFNEEWVFEYWDMVSGRRMPELGGSPGMLDIVGLNYYWTNQWELGREGVPLAEDDPRRVSLAELVRAVYRRYGTDVIITETSALGEARAPWIHELSSMAEQLIEEGVELQGICLYPILSMPEWHARDQWARMGLWDLEEEQNVLRRKACAPMLSALKCAQEHARRRQGRALWDRERVLSLPRTGDVPFIVCGRVVWESEPAEEMPLRIRIVRSDQPYRLWISAIDLCVGERTIHHVSTAAELSMILDDLLWITPQRIAELHGAQSATLADSLQAQWSRDIQSITSRSTEFEKLPVNRVKVSHAPLMPVGGGRY
jgi:hypothetical protein